MKRYFAYNGLVVVAFLLLWIALVVIEVKASPFKFLKWTYAGSLPCVFICFFLASHRALVSSRYRVGFAIVSALIISPVFIFLGGVLITHFKFMMGGHL